MNLKSAGLLGPAGAAGPKLGLSDGLGLGREQAYVRPQFAQ
jgi:hypothetical protein